MSVCKRTYLFSFVIPAFNCAEYVEDAILSVIKQDIGFEDNVQLVLIDDGSTDETGVICDRYATLFPGNVVYIRQENKGVSSARLVGLDKALGTYINFLDADDMWSLDACSFALSFFKSHPDIDMCAARHYYFEAKSGPHPLDYKFEKTRVIDLNKAYEFPQLSLNSLFIRRSVLTPDLFDKRLSVSEDFLAVNLILLDKMKYGVMKRPTYWYRKRQVADSAIDKSTQNLSWYFDTPRYCYRRLFDESLVRYGCVIRPIQYAVMYDLQWRIIKRAFHPLDGNQYDAYQALILDLLKEIDDEIIVAQRNLSTAHKLYILSLKYGITLASVQGGLSFSADEGCCWQHGSKTCVRISNAKSEAQATLQFIRREKNQLVFEGRLKSVFPHHELGLRASVNDRVFCAEIEPRPSSRTRYNSFFEKGFFEETGFVLRIPINDALGTIRFIVNVQGVDVPASFRAGRLCPLSFRVFDFTILDNVMLCVIPTRRDRLILAKASSAKAWSRELLYEAVQRTVHPQTRPYIKYRRKALSHLLGETRLDNEVWLVSDRTTMAGDNGEALYSYIVEHPIEGVDVYFVVNEDSPDYERMKGVGNVIAYRSSQHRELQACANMVISSAADDHVLNLYGPLWYLVRNFERYKYVFLQHGVILHDLSSWINRFNKDIKLLVTSSPRERDSIVHAPEYAYSDEQVVLTGLPRHDRLIALSSEITCRRNVLITPTWRQAVTGKIDPATGKRCENPVFEASSYYEFYEALLNHPKLEQVANSLGYTVDFLVHPALAQEAHKFKSGFANVVLDYNYAYELATSAVLVTDYSSVVFDFALLKKPVVYTHFDKEEFFATQMWDEGYFDYERDGFGKVCSTLEETVDEIVLLMRNPVMPDVYKQRVDDFFFTPPDGVGRCQAVLNSIEDLRRRDKGPEPGFLPCGE